MPHGLFRSVALGEERGTLLVKGESDPAEFVSAIQIAVIALDNPLKRVEGHLNAVPLTAQNIANNIGPTWDAFSPTAIEGNVGLGEFEEGDKVVVVGAATHRDVDSGVPNPFVWHGFFEIQGQGEEGGEVQVGVVDEH